MDQVELVDVGEDLLHGQLHPRQRVAGVADRSERLRHGLDVPAGNDRIAACERRHLVTAAVQLCDETVDDPLRAPVCLGRDTLERRRGLGDPKRANHRTLLETVVTADPAWRGPRSVSHFPVDDRVRTLL